MKKHNNYTHIATAATTVCKTGNGVLERITLNEPTAGTVTIYNNTAASGDVIGIIAASTAAQTLEYDIPLSIGITIVTSGADDMTVVWN